MTIDERMRATMASILEALQVLEEVRDQAIDVASACRDQHVHRTCLQGIEDGFGRDEFFLVARDVFKQPLCINPGIGCSLAG